MILAVVSALFLGASLGFMGGVVFTKHHFSGGPQRQVMRVRGHGRGAPGEMRVMPSARVLLPWLERELDLSAKQVDAIRTEIDRSRSDMESVHDSLHTRVARHLTPKQRERFETMLKQRFPGDHRGRGPRGIRPGPGQEGDPK
jgi:hypothetical protein